ncbi:hypothetical protein DP939_36670 [Spongiactinospora rosea]|uniref:DoxX family protein n=1 Tax=Spongiactinospora rosea TaxID=2248750 RepID=A0A366LMK8_9ACTN|nr:hypothetical protein [Spongiactinospora rosea]RBQ15148.1 hypothetical protein DP939_36670 [Spongiactinospora rosea]
MDVTAAVILAVFLIAVGATHFVLPAYFRSLVPSWIGPARLLVAISGAAEIVVGAVILLPSTRSAGAWAGAALITAYLASHLDAMRYARRGHPSVLLRPFGVAARLLVNLAYIGWAVAVALTAA